MKETKTVCICGWILLRYIRLAVVRHPSLDDRNKVLDMCFFVLDILAV